MSRSEIKATASPLIPVNFFDQRFFLKLSELLNQVHRGLDPIEFLGVDEILPSLMFLNKSYLKLITYYFAHKASKRIKPDTNLPHSSIKALLFNAIKENEEKCSALAVTIIQNELPKKSFHTLLDRIFILYTDIYGKTVINYANESKNQKFLDYCFQTLINFEYKQNSYRKLINFTIPPQDILDELQKSGMSRGSLWLFCLAFVCNQQDLVGQIANSRYWNKKSVNDTPDRILGLSLPVCAFLLNNKTLFAYAMENLSSEEITTLLTLSTDIQPSYGGPKLEGIKGEIKFSGGPGTPFELALKIGKRSMAALILEYMKKIPSFPYIKGLSYLQTLHFSIENQDIETVRFLLQQGVPVRGLSPLQMYGGQKITALSLAAQTGFEDGVKALLEFKAFVDENDRIKGTPLCYAACQGNLEVIKILVENKADFSGYSSCVPPASWAIFAGQHFIVEYLIEQKMDLKKSPAVTADFTRSNFDYKKVMGSPLKVAITNNRTYIAKILLEAKAIVDASIFLQAATLPTPMPMLYLLSLAVSETQLSELITKTRKAKIKNQDRSQMNTTFDSLEQKIKVEKQLAFLMGLHPRAGAESSVKYLQPGIGEPKLTETLFSFLFHPNTSTEAVTPDFKPDIARSSY